MGWVSKKMPAWMSVRIWHTLPVQGPIQYLCKQDLCKQDVCKQDLCKDEQIRAVLDVSIEAQARQGVKRIVEEC
jgi:hypothetical protein